MKPCNHKNIVYCHERFTAKCQSDCEKVKPCGHRCLKRCHVDCSKIECTEYVNKVLPGCKHEVSVKCCIPAEEFEKQGINYKINLIFRWML